MANKQLFIAGPASVTPFAYSPPFPHISHGAWKLRFPGIAAGGRIDAAAAVIDETVGRAGSNQRGEKQWRGAGSAIGNPPDAAG